MRLSKTTSLTKNVRRAAEKHGAQNVVVASLTRTAAQEVAGRDTGIPAKNIATLHAHAFRALDHPKVADVPEGFREWNEHVGGGPLQIQTAPANDFDAPLGDARAGTSEGERLLAEYGIERNRMTDRSSWSPRLLDFAKRWEEWKRESGRLDFTDMIEAALQEVDHLPGDPHVFMLDEAQDLSRLEMALARKWGEATEHFVASGDIDQSLFSFRGSDPDALYSIEPETEHVLSQSYRVPRAVHRYAVDWIEKIETRKKIDYHPRDFEGDVRRMGTSWSRPHQLLPEIEGHIEAGKSVMVMASCAYMLRPLLRMLKEAGLPYHNPYRQKSAEWNPLRTAYRILAFLRPDPRAWPEDPRFWNWEELKAWTDPLMAKGVMTRGAKALIEAHQIEDRFKTSEAHDVPAMEKAFGLFEPEHHEAIFDLSLEWWSAQLRARRKRPYNYPLKVAERRGIEALREEPSLVVGTIHSLKGSEASHVYVFPDVSRKGAEEAQTPAGREAMIRLFYVAFTRAREQLYICKPDARWYLELPQP